MTIKILPPNIINKIAAGEIIKGPLSIIKELIENSLDARANEIKINIERGGKNLISVSDNGEGIKKKELAVAIKKHSTSKLKESELYNIKYLGFRGEALPSIASISLLTIESYHNKEAWSLASQGGEVIELKPSSLRKGTTVTVKDLFFNIPNKLKFLKSEAHETISCINLVNRMALSRCDVNFKMISNRKVVINFIAAKKKGMLQILSE